MRRRLAALALPAVAALVVSACSATGDPTAVAPPAPTVPAPAPAPAPTDPEPTTEPTPDPEPTTGPEPTTEPPADPDPGTDRDAGASREEPAPVGTEVRVGDWSVAVDATITNANDAIANENMFNSPPGDGNNYVLLPVNATYNGGDSGSAWIDLSIAFVGNNAVTYDGSYCGVIPDPLMNAGDVYAGGTASGNVCAEVPVDAIEGGVWRIEEAFNFQSQTARFFASA